MRRTYERGSKARLNFSSNSIEEVNKGGERNAGNGIPEIKQK